VGINLGPHALILGIQIFSSFSFQMSLVLREARFILATPPGPNRYGRRRLLPAIEAILDAHCLPWEIGYDIQLYGFLRDIHDHMRRMYRYAHTLINIDLQIPQLSRNGNAVDRTENQLLYSIIDRHLTNLNSNLDTYFDDIAYYYKGNDFGAALDAFDVRCWGYNVEDPFVTLRQIDSVVSQYLNLEDHF
jgi:hypothetical protein